jgi:hypothetical protein
MKIKILKIIINQSDNIINIYIYVLVFIMNKIANFSKMKNSLFKLKNKDKQDYYYLKKMNMN